MVKRGTAISSPDKKHVLTVSAQAGVGAAGPLSPASLRFALLLALSIPVFWSPLWTLANYSLRTGQHGYDKYSHALLIPLISAALVWRERNRAFLRVESSYRVGGLLFIAALALDTLTPRIVGPQATDSALALQLLGLVLFWVAAFVACYGPIAAGAVRFPLLFLLLIVPLPDVVLNLPIKAVQYGSAELCAAVFNLAGVPFLREGFVFTLPAVTIEVAKECSGIHSTFALFIVSLLAAYLLLSSLWARTLLVLSVLPVVCLSNGLRIAGLTLLASYVDPGFLHGSLHRQGGAGFFLMALAILYLVLLMLQRAERRRAKRQNIPAQSDRAIASRAA